MILKAALSRLRVGRKPEPKPKTKPFADGLGEGNLFRDEGSVLVKGALSVPTGSGNVVVIGKGSRFSGTITIRGSNNKVLIGENCDFRGEILVKGKSQTVSFGDNSTTVGAYILCQENCDVHIGKWCMFSRDIEIRTTDAHSVIDRATGMRLNHPAPVTIGDHVWVGVGAIINKGSIVPSDSIVGAMSFVNGSFDEGGVILAGTPAKVVKSGITWHRSRKVKFSFEEMEHWKG